MNPRTELTSLLEKLHHFPNKTRIHLIQGATLILKMLSKRPDGNTLLRIPEDKAYIDTLMTYLSPFATNIGVGTQKKRITIHNEGKEQAIDLACISNIQPTTFEKLHNILQVEQLLEEVVHRVGNSYQRIIIGLQLENQRLRQLIEQKETKKVEEKKQEFTTPSAFVVNKKLKPGI